MDPRTKDAIRNIPGELKELREKLEEMNKMLFDIKKFTRSTNESVVRKYSKK